MGCFFLRNWLRQRPLSLGKEWFEELNKVYAARRERVFALLQELNCSFSKDQSGLFIWAGIPDQYESGYELSDEVLYNAQVFITPGGIFGKAGEKYVRVSLCSTEEKLNQSISRVKERMKQKAQL